MLNQTKRQENYDRTTFSKILTSSLQILLYQLRDETGEQVSFSELIWDSTIKTKESEWHFSINKQPPPKIRFGSKCEGAKSTEINFFSPSFSTLPLPDLQTDSPQPCKSFPK